LLWDRRRMDLLHGMERGGVWIGEKDVGAKPMGVFDQILIDPFLRGRLIRLTSRSERKIRPAEKSLIKETRSGRNVKFGRKGQKSLGK